MFIVFNKSLVYLIELMPQITNVCIYFYSFTAIAHCFFLT